MNSGTTQEDVLKNIHKYPYHLFGAQLAGGFSQPCSFTSARLQAMSVYKAFWHLFKFFGCKSDALYTAAIRQMDHLSELYEKGKLTSYLKWKVASIFSWGMDQPLPDRPTIEGIENEKPHVLFGGAFYSFQCYMKRHKDYERRLSFFSSILNSKKGLPRPTSNLVMSSVWDTVQILSASKASDDDWMYVIPLEQEVRRTVREVFGKSVTRRSGNTVNDVHCVNDYGGVEIVRPMYDPDDVADQALRLFWPSIKAHTFGYKRSCGGALRALQQCLLLPGILQEGQVERPVSIEEKAHMLNASKCILHKALKLKVVVVTWSDECCEPSLPQVYIEGLKELRSFTFKILKEMALNEDNQVEPVGLAEPLKVRVISKGPPLRYTLLKGIQKLMWKTLSLHPTFLVDRPISADILSKRIGNLGSQEYYISGDYKAATDNIDPRLSEACVDEICKIWCLDPDLRRIFLDALTNHTIAYREDDDLPYRYFRQRWGQLMGSPVSFPILCLINAALSRYAAFPHLRLRDCPMLINGDDIVFRSSESSYLRWLEQTKLGGLTSSVGKTYISDKFLCMNSTFYTHSADFSVLFDNKLFNEIPTLNLALLFGLKKSGNEVGVVDDGEERGACDLGACCTKLVEPWSICEKNLLIRSFLAENRHKFPQYVPWFLPKSYGGLGLPCTNLFFPSSMDRRMAVAIRKGILQPPSFAPRKLGTLLGLYDHAVSQAQEVFGTSEYGSDLFATELLWFMSFGAQGSIDMEEFPISEPNTQKVINWWARARVPENMKSISFRFRFTPLFEGVVDVEDININEGDYDADYVAEESHIACEVVEVT